ncbi:hypothetical protein B7463_g4839, partial [Scytalidium lignicola]
MRSIPTEKANQPSSPQDTTGQAETERINPALARGEGRSGEEDSETKTTQNEGEQGVSDGEIDSPSTVNKGTAREEQKDKSEEKGGSRSTDEPPLPEESIPPLPEEELPPSEEPDDGWAPMWDESAQAFYFYNRFTGMTQWNNPRVPDVSQPGPPGVTPLSTAVLPSPDSLTTNRPVGGYDPAIHGDYDENAWYAQPAVTEEPSTVATGPSDPYAATAAFNRFTGRFQAADITPDNFNDENKSRRQMNAFFDVDAAANSHDGRSLKAERSGKKLTKAELKQFKEKRKAKKEERRRAWLRD